MAQLASKGLARIQTKLNSKLGPSVAISTRQALEGRGMEYSIIKNENLGYFGQILYMQGLVSRAKYAYQLRCWVGLARAYSMGVENNTTSWPNLQAKSLQEFNQS